MKYAKIDSVGELVRVFVPENKHSLIETIEKDGFVPYEEEPKPDEGALSAIESYELFYRDDGDRVVGYYQKRDVDIKKVKAEIERLTVELSLTDYKVIKNHELQMLGFALAYDPEELHAQREPFREAIRELELYLV